MTYFTLGFICGFAACFVYAKWAVRRLGFRLAEKGLLRIPHEFSGEKGNG